LLANSEQSPGDVSARSGTRETGDMKQRTLYPLSVLNWSMEVCHVRSTV